MKRALVLTVGMGKDVEYAIARSLLHHNPDLAAFIVSESSRQLLARVAEILRDKEHQPELANLCRKAEKKGLVKLLPNSDVEDVDQCYRAAEEAIADLFNGGVKPNQVWVDITGGTKPMSAGLALAAIRLKCAEISYVGGVSRDDAGRVIRGSERIKALEPMEVVKDYLLDAATDAFNRYDFESAKSALVDLGCKASLSRYPEAEALLTLADFYQAWDRFDHEAADGLSRQLKDAGKAWKADTASNRKAVHMLAAAKKELNRPSLEPLTDDCAAPLLLGDLFANAQRRGEEGKFDDAVARLYRLTELIAQHALMKSFGIDPSNVDREVLKQRGLLEKYASQEAANGNIQLGLRRSFELLADLGSDVGKLYLENEQWQKHITVRNQSILAHGFTPVGEEVFVKLRDDVSSACRELLTEKKFERAVEWCTFPKLSRR